MSRTEQKNQTRSRILDAAGRGFRKGGFGGVGVDSLAKDAGVTSGAFYTHFVSKAAAFHGAVEQGMIDLQSGIGYFQTHHGTDWWPQFVRFYLGAKRECELAESCALQSLAPEVGRSDATSRQIFQTRLQEIAALIASGPPSPSLPVTVDQALAALATLAGAVTLARAVADPALSATIATAAERTLLSTDDAR